MAHHLRPGARLRRDASSRTSCASSARSSGCRGSSRPTSLREVVRDRDGHLLCARGGASSRCCSPDIRGFTSISERLQLEQVDEMLRGISHRDDRSRLPPSGHRRQVHAATASWRSTTRRTQDAEHALNAIRTALEFQERAITFSARWQAKLGVTIRCGVGHQLGRGHRGKPRLEAAERVHGDRRHRSTWRPDSSPSPRTTAFRSSSASTLTST